MQEAVVSSVRGDPGLLVLILILGAAVAVLVVVVLVLGMRLGRTRGRLEAERGLEARLGEARDDAVKRSRAVLSGQAAEQLAPWLPGFPFDPSECRFVGKPIDFLVFKGSSSGEIKEVVFVEVKSGASSLSRVERSLRDCIEGGRVRWEEYRVR